MANAAFSIGAIFGVGGVIFVEMLIISFVAKLIAGALAKGEKKEAVKENFSVLKSAFIVAAIAVLFYIMGVNSYVIGQKSVPYLVGVGILEILYYGCM